MSDRTKPVLSVVVPLYNEAVVLPHFYAALSPVLKSLNVAYEIVFVNDGSIDASAQIVADLARADKAIRVITFTRNFGKEMATTAGLHNARGQAIIMVDVDGQHPVGTIPRFVEEWRKGAKVVVGKRASRRAGPIKRAGSRAFYSLLRKITGVRLDPDATDFRLIDQEVQAQFNRLTEGNRMTKALIDWLGYKQSYVPYTENTREHGVATYSLRKLLKLAIDSIISLSISPLYITAYIGAVVLPLATLLGLGMIGNFLLSDPLNLHATGGAYLIVLMLFLVGVLLVSQGIIGLYLSHIHAEAQNRPLYVTTDPPTKEAA